MAITISGIENHGAYFSDFGNITLHGVPQEKIRIDFVIRQANETLFSFSENYYPDTDNKVVIRSLGDVAAVYFKNLNIPSPYLAKGSFGAYHILISATIHLADDSVAGSFEQKFYYSDSRTNIPSPSVYDRFCSRFSEVKVTPEQWALVSFLYVAQTLEVSVTYKLENTAAVRKINIPVTAATDEFFWLSVGPEAILSLLNEDTGGTYEIEDLLSYDVILSVDVNVVDSIHYDIDRNYYPQITYVLYYNSFGLPETVYLTGKSSRTSEMEGAFANIDKKYVKYHTKLTTYSDVNSGFINDTMVNALEDLVKSRLVYLVNEEGVGDMITVVEINFNTDKPVSTPNNVSIKYRVSADNMQSFKRDNYESGIFNEVFNETFN